MSAWKRRRGADASGFGPSELGRALGRRVRSYRRGMRASAAPPPGAHEALSNAEKYAKEMALAYEAAPLDAPDFWERRELAVDAEEKRVVFRLGVLGHP